jgi:hypothetical protein
MRHTRLHDLNVKKFACSGKSGAVN